MVNLMSLVFLGGRVRSCCDYSFVFVGWVENGIFTEHFSQIYNSNYQYYLKVEGKLMKGQICSEERKLEK